MKRWMWMLVALLVGGLLVWQLGKEDPYSTLGKDNDFAVKDTSKIGRVFIADRKGGVVTLSRNSNTWIINNKYKANPSVMNTLLRTINGIEVKLRPPREAVNTMVRSLAAEGVKVQIFNLSNKLIRSFYVGGVTPTEDGTYMIMENEEQPFVVNQKNKDGGIKVSFFTNEELWRDKTIFEYNVDDIAKISVEYPKLKNKSFVLESNNGKYSVTPFNSAIPTSKKPLVKSRVESYLRNYKKLVAEAFKNDFTARDSMKQIIPFCIIKVEDVHKMSKVIKLYPIVKTTKDGYLVVDDYGNQRRIEKYFTWVDDKDFMLIQELLFGKILWAYDYFFET